MGRRPTEAGIRSQIPAARTRATAEREAGLRAEAARYDRKTGRIVLELINGYVLGIPVSTLPALRNATHAQLAAVELSATGSAIRFPALDADYSVPGLVLALTAREVGRRGSQVRSNAKSLAAKLNGAKGGRPRTVARAGEHR
ncbi:MAG: DUF2442 domain-containing protein [Gemmatimonadota bacterium]|nr:DUF2442 domain-containing protein [Gemmatimonadota bacterium]